jgi:replication initiator protein RepSA
LRKRTADQHRGYLPTVRRRFATHLRRALAAALGVGAREWPHHGRVSSAKVGEYQRRGLVHFHAVVRLDGLYRRS